jgi:hypothetical protein
MVANEAIAILKILKASYPYFYKDLKKADAEEIINLWATMFADDPAELVVEAVKALIVSLKFPPTIADVKEKIQLICTPVKMTEIEAWNMVYRAICCANYHSVECFERFPENIKRLVGSPKQLRDWAVMDAEVVRSVIQSNFMRSYTARVKNDREIEALPESTKTMIEGVTDKFKMIG